jgi:pyruvate/2-oxoglutarate/acetoin dehydrogenase E1 component/TPP-dependent pyruvate/acetoin dehydrogenase alpha subunit
MRWESLSMSGTANDVMRMPDLSSISQSVTVVRWLVEPGAHVQRGEPLLEVETDKAIMIVESVQSGTFAEALVSPGEDVPTGAAIARFLTPGSATPPPIPRSSSEAPIASASSIAPMATTGKPSPSRRTEPWPKDSLFDRNRRAAGMASQTTARAQKTSATSGEPILAPTRAIDAPAEFLLDLYERMVLIREFEEGVKFLFLEGSMPGTIHQCQGQEATAVGVCAALRSDDFITSTFRGHGHALAKGLSIEDLLFELFGATTGCCRGKGGSMHMGSMARGMVPGIAIVGGGIPLAAGMALALKQQGSDRVVACFFGDGAVAEGAFHEGINLAAIWNLPVLFVCENNLYGASTRIDQVMRVPRVADRAASYGIEGLTIDGNDVCAVYDATLTAAHKCRRGEGPILLELLTYRLTGHSRRDACHYQPTDEREDWSRRDPIERFGRVLLNRRAADQNGLDRIRESVQARFQAAVEEARRQPLPTLADLASDVLADSPAVSVPRNTQRTSGAPARRLSIAEALREAIAEEMRRDPAVFCMGEDIAVPGGWGGAFTVTLDLEREFPDRMLNTPIAELGFFGAGVGAAILGQRPIVDVQYADFLLLAMDQIVNNAAKLRYMSGGEITVPLVMRAPVGATGRGAQHAQTLERFFIGVPGLKVVAVSNAYDAKGMLKSAVRDQNPVLFFEHKLLYGSKGARAEPGAVDATSDIPEGEYLVPLDRAVVRRAGKDVTVLGWLLMVHFARQAADAVARNAIDVEVIDVRSLAPIDYDTIGQSVRKTGRVVIVEEGPRAGGVAAELAAGILELFGDSLLAPVIRVASPDVPVPFSPVLENAYRPDVPRIIEAIRSLVD